MSANAAQATGAVREAGVYTLSEADYHAQDAASKHDLDLVHRSPRHYWAARRDPHRAPEKRTPTLTFGQALHTLILEPDLLWSRFGLLPEGDRRSKAVKDALERIKADGKEALGWDDWQRLQRMRAAILAHPACAYLFAEGDAEQSYFWRDEQTGLLCRARPDFVTADGIIVELKSAEDASPTGFRRAAHNYRYHVQAPWYTDALLKATGEVAQAFLFVAVEKEPPHAVAVYAPSAKMLTLGRREARSDLELLAHCRAHDEWPAYGDDVMTLELPEWIARYVEDEGL